MVETIEIYGSESCPHCVRAKAIAETLVTADVTILPAGSMPPGSRAPGHKTIPAVVVDGTPIGGADELQELATALSLARPPDSAAIKSSGKGITGDAKTKMSGTCGQAGGAKKSSKSSKSPSKRKPSAYAKFVKKFAADHKGHFKGPALMKNAGAAWGKMTDAEKGKFK